MLSHVVLHDKLLSTNVFDVLVNLCSSLDSTDLVLYIFLKALIVFLHFSRNC